MSLFDRFTIGGRRSGKFLRQLAEAYQQAAKGDTVLFLLHGDWPESRVWLIPDSKMDALRTPSASETASIVREEDA